MADIYRGNTSISNIYRGQDPVSAVYRGQSLIWPQASAGFDPTLGGTITPYFWYDFTDTATMTFSSGTSLTAIASKGSNTGDIAKGTASPKYTTAWVAPEYISDAYGGYVHFNGVGGTSSGTLARRYGTDQGRSDEGGSANSNSTLIGFIKPQWGLQGVGTYGRLISWKGYSTIVTQPEEFTPIAISYNSNYPGTEYYMAGSPTSVNFSVQSHALSGGNNSAVWSYNGSAAVVDGELTGWHSQVMRQTATGGSYSSAVGLRESAEVSSGFDGQRNGNNSLHENFAIGGRSRSDNTGDGANAYIRHVLTYNQVLTDGQIDALLASYRSAYPDDNLNP